jgi:hypothetical protein
MTTLTVSIDEPTEARLREMSANEGIDLTDLASRLLTKAAESVRSRPVFDIDTLKAYAAEYGEEEEALAESGIEHRAQLLADEDNA